MICFGKSRHESAVVVGSTMTSPQSGRNFANEPMVPWLVALENRRQLEQSNASAPQISQSNQVAIYVIDDHDAKGLLLKMPWRGGSTNRSRRSAQGENPTAARRSSAGTLTDST